MTITRSQFATSTGTYSTTAVVPYASAVTAGSLLVAAINAEQNGSQASTSSVTDNLNGAWTKLVSALYHTSSWFGEVSIWALANAAAGATTVTGAVGPGTPGRAMGIAEYTGMPATLTTDITSTKANDSGTTHITPAVSTSFTDLLIGAFGNWGDATVFAATSGWTKVTGVNPGAGDYMLEDQGVGSAGMASGSYSASGTTAATSNTANVFAAIRATTGGGAAPFDPIYTLSQYSGMF